MASVYRRSKLNLKLSFETQPFKPKNKKVIKTVYDKTWREPLFTLLFFTFRSHQRCKNPYKKKNCSPKNEACVRGRRLFSSEFLLNKIRCQFFK